MAFFSGSNGRVVVGSSPVANVTSWDLTVEADELDATSMGYAWKQTITGMRGWSGSIDAQWDLTDNAQLALFNALTGATPVTLLLYIDATKRFTGQAYITSAATTEDVGDIVTISFDFTGTGTLSLVT